MARPTVIQNDSLLEAARELFLKRGLNVTTAEIAKKAGVSQGILFKRFKTKQALFRAAMDVEVPAEKMLPFDLKARLGKGRVEETLTDLGIALVEKFFAIVPTTMMDWSNPREEVSDEDAFIKANAGPQRAVEGLRHVAEYLAGEVKLGRIKSCDAEVIAQTFIGALWHYAFLQVTVGEVHKHQMTRHEYVSSVVRLLWGGLAP